MAKRKIDAAKPVRKSRKSANFELHCGDCVKLMAGLSPNSVDLVAGDPPYGIGWPGYDKYRDNLRDDQYVEWSKQWLAEAHRILRPTGSFWLAIGDEFVSELDVAAKQLGFHPRGKIVWYFTFGVACPAKFSRTHIFWLYYTKHKTKFTFNTDAVRVPSARQLKYGDKRAVSKGKTPDDVWILHPDAVKACFKGDHDTWLASRVCGTFGERAQRGKYKEQKTCPQMPEAIMQRIVEASSNPGDLVADPFLGTGTSGAVAVRLGRRFWGCDISKNYVMKARKRIEAAK